MEKLAPGEDLKVSRSEPWQVGCRRKGGLSLWKARAKARGRREPAHVTDGKRFPLAERSVQRRQGRRGDMSCRERQGLSCAGAVNPLKSAVDEHWQTFNQAAM